MQNRIYELSEEKRDKTVQAFTDLINFSEKMLATQDIGVLDKESFIESIEAAKVIKEELIELRSQQHVIVREFSKVNIIQLFANEIIDEEDEDNRFYGDIYSKPQEVYENHPNATLLVGYGILDKSTGYIHEDSADWYDNLLEVLSFAKEIEGK